MSFLDSIIERHQRYGCSRLVGEWAAIQAEDRAEYLKALDAGDRAQLQAMLETMFQGPLSYGIVSYGDALAQLPQQTLWRLAMWAKLTPSPNQAFARLAAPAAGTPYAVPINDVPMMVDAPRFDVYAQRILRALPASGGTVLEIGSGYGGVALQLLRQSDRVRVVLVDIPETLYLAGWWLSEVSGKRVAWFDDDPSADVVLVPAQKLDWAPGADLVCAFHTFSGLDKAAAAGYLAWLSVCGARHFYHDDAVEAAPGVWMNDRFPETLVSALPIPASFKLEWQERTPWTGITDRFSEFFYARTTS